MPTKIIHNDFALIDKQTEITLKTNDEKSWSNSNNLKQDLLAPSFMTAEINGTSVNQPYYFKDYVLGVGYYSSSISDDSGVFSSNPTLKIEISKQITSNGITLYFSELKDDYPKQVTIKWYNGTTILSNIAYFPTGNKYYCENTVENYNKVEIIFVKWNLSGHWAKLYKIDFGATYEYSADNHNLFSATMNEYGNIIPNQTRPNTSNVEVVDKQNKSWQKSQNIDIFYGNGIKTTHYIKEYSINGDRVLLKCYDMFDKLPDTTFDIYAENTFISDTFGNIISNFYDYGVTVVDSELLSITVNGKFKKLPTYKEALKAFCFAVMAYIDTSETDCIKIKSITNQLNSINIVNIPEPVFIGNPIINGNEIYKSVTIKAENQLGQTISRTKTNPNTNSSDKVTEFNISFYSVLDTMINLYSDYYFKNIFVDLKSVSQGEKINQPVTINNKNLFVYERTLNLSGDPIFIKGKYKER